MREKERERGKKEERKKEKEKKERKRKERKKKKRKKEKEKKERKRKEPQKLTSTLLDRPLHSLLGDSVGKGDESRRTFPNAQHPPTPHSHDQKAAVQRSAENAKGRRRESQSRERGSPVLVAPREDRNARKDAERRQWDAGKSDALEREGEVWERPTHEPRVVQRGPRSQGYDVDAEETGERERCWCRAVVTKLIDQPRRDDRDNHEDPEGGCRGRGSVWLALEL